MIKFNEIIDNKEYRERVIKYFRLPIRLSASKAKFLSDLEFMKKTKPTKYNLIVDYIEKDFNKLAKEQGTSKPDFTMENILEPLLEEIRSNSSWGSFMAKDYSGILDDYNGIKNVHGFYKKENSGKYFLSIDLETANWQSLQNIVGFKESYEDLIVKYTNNLIPPISKSFRTKITGVLGAKNIMYYNKKLLKENYKKMLRLINTKVKINVDQEPFAFYADEVLFEVDKETYKEIKLFDFEELIEKETGIKTHVVTFKLKWLGVEKGCAKIYDKNNFELLTLSKDIKLLYEKDLAVVKANEVDFEKINLRGKTRDEYLKMISQSNQEIKKTQSQL